MNRGRTMVRIWAAILSAAWAAAPAVAGDLAAEQKVQQLCAGCHGPAGKAVNPLWPNLAGQNAPYLAKTLRDYQSGARQDPSMTALAGTLTDAEIEAISDWYSRQ